jgi:cysteine synthase A
MDQTDRCSEDDRAWVTEAIAKVSADANRSADTHLLPFPLPSRWGIDLYLKDESVHPTGSLKHRLARSLFLYALCNGWIRPGTTIVEASSGSTAGLRGVLRAHARTSVRRGHARSTSKEKCELIEFQGAECHLVDDPAKVVAEARALADSRGGHFMDQFTYAERATDWRGNNNIAESIFQQMALERHPVPAWIVVGAGTGGTSATIGRYVRYQRHGTKVCVVDPENSAFYPAYESGDWLVETRVGSRIEGIGRPKVEASFLPSIVDKMIRVPDAASLATMRVASGRPRASRGRLDGHKPVGRLRLDRPDARTG